MAPLLQGMLLAAKHDTVREQGMIAGGLPARGLWFRRQCPPRHPSSSYGSAALARTEGGRRYALGSIGPAHPPGVHCDGVPPRMSRFMLHYPVHKVLLVEMRSGVGGIR